MMDRPTEAAALWGRTQDLLLATYAEFYRHEVGAEEDVHRTLPFFGTALGLVIGAIAYGAGRLPPWQEAQPKWPFVLAAALLVLSLCEAGAVLFWLGRAIARRNYRRIGPEVACLLRGARAGPRADRHANVGRSPANPARFV